MRLPLTLKFVLAVSLPSVLAVGTVYVANTCSYDVFLWSVGSNVGPKTLLHQYDLYSEQYHYDNKTGGISIKITTKDNGLYDASPQLNLAYALDVANRTIYYDISDVFGDPFSGETVVLVGKEGCPAIIWPDGIPPAGTQTQACSDDTDLYLTFCRDKVS